MQRIAERVGRALERQGLLVCDCEHSYLPVDPKADGVLDNVLGASITSRIAVGPRAVQKVFTVQTVLPAAERDEQERVARASGFSLHAWVAAKAGERDTLGHLCRYVARPAVASARLAVTSAGAIRYALKTPYRNAAGFAASLDPPPRYWRAGRPTIGAAGVADHPRPSLPTRCRPRRQLRAFARTIACAETIVR